MGRTFDEPQSFLSSGIGPDAEPALACSVSTLCRSSKHR